MMIYWRPWRVTSRITKVVRSARATLEVVTCWWDIWQIVISGKDCHKDSKWWDMKQFTILIFYIYKLIWNNNLLFLPELIWREINKETSFQIVCLHLFSYSLLEYYGEQMNNWKKINQKIIDMVNQKNSRKINVFGKVKKKSKY